MIGPLQRRLIVLERAPAAEGPVLRVMALMPANADSGLPDDGVNLIQVITGVTRSPGAEPA